MSIPILDHIIGGEVITSDKALLPYSHDASIFEIKPQAVVSPTGVSDLKAVVSFVVDHKSTNPSLSLTARSGGTDMSGGPLNDSIIVDFTAHFNHLASVVGTSIVTEPGVFYRDFEKETLQAGLIMPSYPASRQICTVGGMVANNSGGEKSLSYGKTEKYVEELRVVLSDAEEYTFGPLSKDELEAKMQLPTFEGTVYREMHQLVEDNYELIVQARPHVSKNSAGYALWNIWDRQTFNLAKLFVGAQGTLGFITKIKFGLVKTKPHSELLVVFLKNFKELGHIVNEVMRYDPESFESYDNHTLKLALKYLPEIIEHMQGHFLSLLWQFLPEVWMTLTGGIPKLVLIAEFTGETESIVAQRVRVAQQAVQEKFKVKSHVTKSSLEAQKYWVVRRESFNLLRRHVRNKHTAPFIDDIIVTPEVLPEFLPKLDTILSQYPHLIYTIAGHAGDANFHIIPLMNLADEQERNIIPKLSHEVYDLVLQYKGSITGEHNDGLIRSPYLEQMYGREVYDLFKRTKQIFDPLNIFNPRKKIGSTMEYALSHIKYE